MDVSKLPFSEAAFEKLKAEVKRLQLMNSDYLLIQKMKTPVGFLQLFYLELKESRTNNEAFLNLNDRYFDLTGEYRYSSYNSFKTGIKKILKNQK